MASNLKQRVAAWVWRQGRDAVVLLVVVIAFVLGYSLRGGGEMAPVVADVATTSEPEQWYTCSMHPDVRMPNPEDKCPTCLMDLVPVASPADGRDELGPRQIELSPAAEALIHVETTPVVRRSIERHVRMVGRVDYDETRLASITAYAAGRLDRLFVDYTGIDVRKGDHLAEIYSPSLLVAQQELIGARRRLDRLGAEGASIARDVVEALAASSRERLRLLGMTPEQIEATEARGVTGDHVTLYAPIGGVVIDKHARQGSYVKEGDAIYTIADLSRVWVVAEAYESDLPWLRYGQTVQFRTEAFGDEPFEGTIAFIDPLLDRQRRTARVRVNVDNEERRLRPGMFVRASVRATVAAGGRVVAPELAGKWISPMHPEVVSDRPGNCTVCGMALVPAEELGYAAASAEDEQAPLVVPASAVLRTGRRGIVYVKTTEKSEPVFEGREVELGARGERFFIVRAGLREGEQVVVRGNFQIDSAIQIQARPSMMSPAGSGAASPAGQGHDHD